VSRKAPKAKGVAMMARKTMNLLESESLMKVRLRRLTDKASRDSQPGHGFREV